MRGRQRHFLASRRAQASMCKRQDREPHLLCSISRRRGVCRGGSHCCSAWRYISACFGARCSLLCSLALCLQSDTQSAIKVPAGLLSLSSAVTYVHASLFHTDHGDSMLPDPSRAGRCFKLLQQASCCAEGLDTFENGEDDARFAAEGMRAGAADHYGPWEVGLWEVSSLAQVSGRQPA